MKNMKLTCLKLFIALLVYAGVSILLVRFWYRRGLFRDIAELKGRILQDYTLSEFDKCSEVMASDGNKFHSCAKICTAAAEAAELRHKHMEDMREEYKFAGLAARLFDQTRGMPSESRIESLMAKKSCVRLLAHVDHSNKLVDYFCAGLLVIAYFISLTFLGTEVCTKLFQLLFSMLAIEEDPLYALAGVILTAIAPELVAPFHALYSSCSAMFDDRVTITILQLVLLACGVSFLIAPPGLGSAGLWLAWTLQKLVSLCALLETAGLVIEQTTHRHKD